MQKHAVCHVPLMAKGSLDCSFIQATVKLYIIRKEKNFWMWKSVSLHYMQPPNSQP